MPPASYLTGNPLRSGTRKDAHYPHCCLIMSHNRAHDLRHEKREDCLLMTRQAIWKTLVGHGESMIKPTQTIKEFSKVNTKNSTAFIYTQDNQLGDTMGDRDPVLQWQQRSEILRSKLIKNCLEPPVSHETLLTDTEADLPPQGKTPSVLEHLNITARICTWRFIDFPWSQ